MTPFRALYTLLGLSQDRAERLLSVNHKTVEHYLAGVRRRAGQTVPVRVQPGVMAEMRACWLAIDDHAARVIERWEKTPAAAIDMAPVSPAPVSGDWSVLDADALAMGLVVAELPPEVTVRMVPAVRKASLRHLGADTV